MSELRATINAYILFGNGTETYSFVLMVFILNKIDYEKLVKRYIREFYKFSQYLLIKICQ